MPESPRPALSSRRRCATAVLLAIAAVASVTLPPPLLSLPVRADDTPPAAAPADLSARLAAMEKEMEEERAKIGVPGMSVVVVQDDRVIYMKGLGLRHVEKKLPVTPDTLFAIGSSTKAFTALTVMMGVDEGKIRLEDSPKRFLPYFKMRDPETDAKITVRDLLSHRSGLNRTDLAMITGKLSREELIRVACLAKPTAKLGEKFQYQNIMYAAAGEVVAKAYKKSWEKVVEDRILKPLGMKGSTLSVPKMRRAKDLAQGYSLSMEDKALTALPIRDIDEVAPAGAINSNARDMAQWLRLMLGEGVFEGKRLVSEKSYAHLLTEQIKMGPGIGYGLGWMLREWNGHKFAEHGGNIDGYNAQVAFMPDRKLGVVLLTNVSGSPLTSRAMGMVWKHLVEVPKKDEEKPGLAPMDPKTVAGEYLFAAANLAVNVDFRDGKLVMTVAGQPPYSLEPVSGGRYKLAAPAPDGFFATFRPSKDDPEQTELYLEQPQGNVAFVRKKAGAATAAQKPFESLVTVDELLAKMTDAMGGEANIRKHTTRVSEVTIDMEHQGVTGEGTITAKAPNLQSTSVTLLALGKKIATIHEYFDGKGGAEALSFAPVTEPKKGKALKQAEVMADFYEPASAKNLYEKIEIRSIEKAEGEDAYVVVKTPKNGAEPIREYVSTKTFLVLRRDITQPGPGGMGSLPVTEIFRDYRAVDGVMVPFTTISKSPVMGDAVTRVKTVRWDVPVKDDVFRGPGKKK